MKSLVKFVAFIACFSVSSLMAQSMVGDWKLDGSMPDGTPVSHKVSFADDGTYSVDLGMDGVVDIKGTYETDGNQVTLTDTEGEVACIDQKGVYTFEVGEDSVTVTRVDDPCPGRGEGPESMTMAKL